MAVQITILIEDGLIQNIVSTEPLTYVIIDTDTEGADPDELQTIIGADGGAYEVFELTETPANVDAEHVRRIFAQVRGV